MDRDACGNLYGSYKKETFLRDIQTLSLMLYLMAVQRTSFAIGIVDNNEVF